MFEGKSPLTTFVLRPYLLLAAIVAGCAGTPVARQSQSAAERLRCRS
jgi:hypothetical protein